MAIQRFSRNSKDNEGVVDPLQLFGNLSQTSYYQVDFSSLTTFPPTRSDEITLLKFLEDRGIDKDFIARSSGLLCSEASLPATSLATGEVKDNFMGISQEFAHTRLYTDFDFTFYIDSDYKNLKFFESWIDYISGGSVAVPTQSNYYRRMRYPDSYKCQTISITKFEKNLNSGNTLKYSFINAFPKTISAVPVSYGNSDILKVNVSFNYDRYVVNATSGFTKGEQDKFEDIVQESAELQQRFNDREQSLAPTPTPILTPIRTTAATTQAPPSTTLDPKSNEAAILRQEEAKEAAQREIIAEGEAAATTESTRTGYVDPYAARRKQTQKNQADREKYKNRPDLFF